MGASGNDKGGDALLWKVAEHPLAVECPWTILEEIHGAVQDGLRRLSRGGVEVGGVLFGRKTDSAVCIMAWRPIACEHSRGPAFLLSGSDKQALIGQLEAAGRDPVLQVLEPVGWFVSHTRAGLSMTEDDLETFELFFADSWNVTLVYHPNRGGETHAGFFMRGADGKVRTAAPYREFTVTNVRAVKPEASAPVTGQPPVPGWGKKRERAPISEPAVPETRAGGHRLVVLATVILILGALALFALPRLRPTAVSQDPLQLMLLDAQGQLRVEWNRDSGIIDEADSASLIIADGGAVPSITLDKDTLRSGSVTYARLTEDVSVRLVVRRQGQLPYQELARYVGSPVPKTETKEMMAAREGRSKMMSEALKLKAELEIETKRMQGLERTVKRLQAQLERDAGKR